MMRPYKHPRPLVGTQHVAPLRVNNRQNKHLFIMTTIPQNAVEMVYICTFCAFHQLVMDTGTPASVDRGFV